MNRVLRVPGSVNYPTRAKFEGRGLGCSQAGPLLFQAENIYDWGLFKQGEVPEEIEHSERPDIEYSNIAPLVSLENDPRLVGVNETCILVIRDGEDSTD